MLLLLHGKASPPRNPSLRPYCCSSNSPSPINIVALQEAVTPADRQHAAFLMDMAKAETLDAMGENRAAVSIVDV